MTIRFDRHELAGSLGDIGVMLPLALALIQVNGVDSTALLLMAGLYYILSGAYFGVVMPVQPMKVIAAYAIARSLTPLEISTAGFLIGALLVILALTRAIDLIGALVPKPVIRGVQLTTGVILLTKGVRFVLEGAGAGAAEPNLNIQHLGPVPIGLVLGGAAFVTVLLLLRSKRVPAALVIVVGGATVGLALGAWRGLAGISPSLHLPALLPDGLPDLSLILVMLTMLVLPQVPMTIGNAVLAQADLTREYFGEEVARRATPRALTLSMGLANIVTALFGGMPLCHGSGGLAAHYRFGARTAGANMIIGGAFIIVALVLGEQTPQIFGVIPYSVLGALLIFSGIELAIVVRDTTDRNDFFITLVVLGVASATNLAWGFAVGWALALLIRKLKLEV